MNFQVFLRVWCGLGTAERVRIVTDTEQEPIAWRICSELRNACEVVCYEAGKDASAFCAGLTESDLLIALFSFDTFVNKKANGLFSPFSKPKGLAAKFAFIRLGISEASLRQGLATPKARVYQAVEALRRIPDGARLRVTSAAGTDLTLQVQAFGTCEHEIAENGGMAFLPASEISAEVIGGSAEGRIAVDVTVGQLYRFGELLGNFGRVAEPVVLTVRGGVIADVSGGAAAAELKEKLFALHTDCRKLVELGFGLSNMEPTGLIGVDESIIGTCHFGLGDGGECGVHLDLVVSAPEIASVVSGERAAVIQ